MEVAERRALVIGLYGTSDLRRHTPDHLKGLEEIGFSVWQTSIPRKRPHHRLAAFVRLLPALRRAEVVVTDEYFNAVIVAGLLWLLRLQARHVVIGLNVSGQKSLVTGWPLLNRMVNRVFRRMDLIFVASRAEADVFSALHAIPKERFSFLHWAYDLPTVPGAFARPQRPYFCMIGRNNRDIASFAAAMRGLEADGVIICHQPVTVPLPENVVVYREIPLGDCIDCIRGCVANVVLVQDESRGAGHITIVTAMHCGRPQIISGVATTLDYFTDRRHAITVGLGDVVAIRAAMQRLLSDPALCDGAGCATACRAMAGSQAARRGIVAAHRGLAGDRASGMGRSGMAEGDIGMTQADEHPIWAMVDQLQLINLASRPDRLKAFRADLARAGIALDDPRFVRFAAIRPDSPAGFPSIGARGCFLSHRGVLEGFLSGEGRALCVCEDDLAFGKDLRSGLDALSAETGGMGWDILYLGHQGATIEKAAGGRFPVLAPHVGLKCTHFYLIKRGAAARFAAFLDLVLTRPPGHPDGGPMHVDGALSMFRAANPDLVTRVAVPPLGRQRPSRTDIHPLQFYDRLPLLRDVAQLARRWMARGSAR